MDAEKKIKRDTEVTINIAKSHRKNGISHLQVDKVK